MSQTNQPQSRPRPYHRITIDLSETERDLLQILCDEDFRNPAQELRYLMATEARRRGLKPGAGMIIDEAQ